MGRGPGRTVGALVALLVLATGCSGGGVAEQPPRKLAVDAIINQVIVPGYEALATASWRLKDVVVRWCDKPSPASDADASAAFTAVVERWAATTTYGIGPAVDRGSDETIRGAVAILASLVVPGTVDAAQSGCGGAVDAAAAVDEEAVALERAWNAGPDDGLPYRSSAAGVGDASIPNEQAIAEIRRRQIAAVDAARSHATVRDSLNEAERATGDIAVQGRLGGIRDVHLRLGGLIESGAARHLRTAIDAAIEAAPAVGAPATVDTGELVDALDDLEDAIGAAVPAEGG